MLLKEWGRGIKIEIQVMHRVTCFICFNEY
jgi:hypothetical protein